MGNSIRLAENRPVRRTIATRGEGISEVLADALRIGGERVERADRRRRRTLAGARIHHVGIAVRSLEEAAGRFGGLLGLERGAFYELPEFGVKALFLPVGEGNLELLEPLATGSTVSSFLEKRGEGMHHICFEVDDIEKALAKDDTSGVA